MGQNLFVSQLNYVTILCTYYWCDVTASLARVVKFIQQVDGNLESNKDKLPKYKLILRSVESSQVMHSDIMATPA